MYMVYDTKDSLMYPSIVFENHVKKKLKHLKLLKEVTFKTDPRELFLSQACQMYF